MTCHSEVALASHSRKQGLSWITLTNFATRTWLSAQLIALRRNPPWFAAPWESSASGCFFHVFLLLPHQAPTSALYQVPKVWLSGLFALTTGCCMSAFLSSHTHTHGDSMSLAHVGLALRLSALYFSQEFESTKRHFPPPLLPGFDSFSLVVSLLATGSSWSLCSSILSSLCTNSQGNLCAKCNLGLTSPWWKKMIKKCRGCVR